MNILKTAALLLAALLAAGCAPKEWTAEGYFSNPETARQAEGREVYLKTGVRGRTIDTARVRDGRFTFSGTPDIHSKYSAVVISGSRIYVCDFIPQAGRISLDMESNSRPRGTRLNEELSWLYDNTGGLILKSQKDYADLRDRKNAGEISPDEFDALVREMFGRLNSDLTSNAKSSYEKNKHNAVGYTALATFAGSLELHELDSLIQVSGERAASFPELVRIRAARMSPQGTGISPDRTQGQRP